MKVFHQFLVLLGGSLLIVFLCWGYTTLQLARAARDGIHASAEQAMLSLIEKAYADPKDVEILYAGTNSLDGSEPHIWYVIAEVRAAAHADGSGLGPKGCEAPGSFFLQTKTGWVHMPEGAFPVAIGRWMKLFKLSGPGAPTAATNWAANQAAQFCLPE